MKTLVTACAAAALLSLAAITTGASAAISDGVTVTPAAAGSQIKLADGYHRNCAQGPRGWWHRNGPIFGVPLPCVPRG